MEASSAAELQKLPELPSPHFVCFLAWDAPDSDDVLREVARLLLEGGAAHVSAFGRRCERLEELLDQVALEERFGDDGDQFVMSHGRTDESLELALWRDLFGAFVSPGYQATTRAFLAIALNSPERARIMRECLARPLEFNERMIADSPSEPPTSAAPAEETPPPPASVAPAAHPFIPPARSSDAREPSSVRAATLAKVAANVLVGCGALLALSLLYCFAMPGESLEAPLPALSSEERSVAPRLRRHVEQLAHGIGPRRATLGDSLRRAERYITSELEPAAKLADSSPRREPIQGAPGDPANVVFELPASKSGKVVLIGAHYDTDQHGTPGANDNASGTAAALVLAERLAQSRHALPIRFVFFANEEQPYFRSDSMGSLQHARRCRERGEQLKAMLSLETMGYYSDQPGSQKYPAPLSAFYPDRGDFIGFVGNLGSRSLVRDVIGRFRAHATVPAYAAALPEDLPGVGWSDHWAFWQQGYQAIMVTDTAPFRDPHYHRATDVAANLDYERLARVVVGLERVIAELARE
jgi:hypothetical protein